MTRSGRASARFANADTFSTKQDIVSYLDKRVEPSDLGEGTLDPKSPVVANTPVGGARGKFYHYMIQECVRESLHAR